MTLDSRTAGSNGRVRLLVVDDDPALRHVTRLRAARQGLHVVGEAADGAAAIEETRRHRPDVVLLDLQMPVLDGLEAIPGIRRACSDTRIVMLSAHEARREECLSAGAHEWVAKSEPWPAIRDAIERSVLDQERRRNTSVAR